MTDQRREWAWCLFWCVITLSVSAGASGCGFMPKVHILRDPLTAQEHLILGISYEAQGKMDQAMAEYRGALKKGGRAFGVTPLINLGNVHARRGEFKQARRYYRKALARESGNGQALNNLAWVSLQERENLDEAEEMVRQALKLIAVDNGLGPHIQRGRVLDTLAEILIAQGRFTEALVVLQEARDLVSEDDPGLGSHLYTLQALAYEALGQFEEAELARQRAIARR